MKAREVLDLWTGWDSPDRFTVTETAPDGRMVSDREMSGLEFVKSPLSEREVKRFGSYGSGKGEGSAWWHHVEIAAET